MGEGKEIGTMKIIIEHSRTKREINGPFSLCGTQEDLQSVAEQILAAIKEDFHFGWVKIHPERHTHLADTPPEQWDA